eukprot:gnl/Hemi2/23613_TR7921_c0_g1_i1.p1 gnl/Hemi2/23613_TR7921_c0_g1~~gnl/Hemi2/23613_TR7921_c0_g1_i1.p1  ORF type:complete len:282 (-),score=72.51 gnl/Hemi2/23613_TR7921_c0_g1_i1:260-1105(-)
MIRYFAVVVLVAAVLASGVDAAGRHRKASKVVSHLPVCSSYQSCEECLAVGDSHHLNCVWISTSTESGSCRSQSETPPGAKAGRAIKQLDKCPCWVNTDCSGCLLDGCTWFPLSREVSHCFSSADGIATYSNFVDLDGDGDDNINPDSPTKNRKLKEEHEDAETLAQRRCHDTLGGFVSPKPATVFCVFSYDEDSQTKKPFLLYNVPFENSEDCFSARLASALVALQPSLVGLEAYDVQSNVFRFTDADTVYTWRECPTHMLGASRDWQDLADQEGGGIAR